jgi:hypothetical protein
MLMLILSHIPGHRNINNLNFPHEVVQCQIWAKKLASPVHYCNHHPLIVACLVIITIIKIDIMAACYNAHRGKTAIYILAYYVIIVMQYLSMRQVLWGTRMIQHMDLNAQWHSIQHPRLLFQCTRRDIQSVQIQHDGTYCHDRSQLRRRKRRHP